MRTATFNAWTFPAQGWGPLCKWLANAGTYRICTVVSHPAGPVPVLRNVAAGHNSYSWPVR